MKNSNKSAHGRSKSPIPKAFGVLLTCSFCVGLAYPRDAETTSRWGLDPPICGKKFLGYASSGDGVINAPRRGEICFSGIINEESARKVILQLRSSGTNPVMYVNSPGGEVGPALDLAEELERLRATVVAYRTCASSCANYIFIAAHRRFVAKNTLLLFHGWVSQESLDDLRRAIADMKHENPGLDENAVYAAQAAPIISQEKRQSELLRRRGVSPQLVTMFSGADPMKSNAAHQTCGGSGAQAILISRDSLAAAGLLIDGYDGPRTARDLDRELERRKKEGAVCFWDAPV